MVDWNKASMLRHLWDMARKKDSLWVKWCHMYMFRNNSVWSCRCAADTSWTWRKLPKLRSSAILLIKYRVGNGRCVFVWYDNWHPLGPLKARFGYRVVYDSASRDKAKV